MKKKKIKKISRSEAILAIALAGISAAVALLCVWLGVVVRFSTIAFFVAAGIALMIPISKKFYLSSLFAYGVSSALAFLITGDITTVIGYIAYFGPMSIFTAIIFEKKIKWYFAYPFKIIYINGALALMYFVLGTVMLDPTLIASVSYAVIAVVGTIALLAVDFVMQMVMKFIVPKISRALHSIKRKGDTSTDGNTDGTLRDGATPDDDIDDVDDENPFEEE